MPQTLPVPPLTNEAPEIAGRSDEHYRNLKHGVQYYDPEKPDAGFYITGIISPANATRICASWDACASQPVEVLETGAMQKALELVALITGELSQGHEIRPGSYLAKKAEEIFNSVAIAEAKAFRNLTNKAA